MVLIRIRHTGDVEENEHTGIIQIVSNIFFFVVACDKALSAGLFSSLPIKST